MKTQSAHVPRIALALAGGGPLGAIYEVGALFIDNQAQPIERRRMARSVARLQQSLGELGSHTASLAAASRP
jgi:hypothetical protein